MMCSLIHESNIIPGKGSKALKYGRLGRAEPSERYEIEGLEAAAPGGSDGIGVGGSSRRTTGCRLVADQSLAADSHERAVATSKLKRAILVCAVFMVLETVGGTWAGSLAVLADAAHMLSDVAGFSISLLALRASAWVPTSQQTFGYFRLEVLGALVSVQIVWVMTGIILYEAFQRVWYGFNVVNGRLVFFIACAGLALNVVVILVLGHGGHDHSGGGHRHGDGDGEGHEHDHHFLVGSHLRNRELDSVMDLDDEESEIGMPKFRRGGGSDLRELEERSNESGVEVELHAGGADGNNYGRGSEALMAMTGESGSLLREVHHNGDSPFDYDVEMVNSRKPVEEEFEDDLEGQGARAPKDGVNINLRGAYIHALGDLIQNAGVLVAGAVIWVRPQWHLIDIICSVVFAAIVLVTTMKMLKDIMWVLMESSSTDLDVEMLRSGLLQISGVSAVTDLHVWALTPGTNLLMCHLEVVPGTIAKEVLHDATEYCQSLHQIKHVTIQIEEGPQNATV